MADPLVFYALKRKHAEISGQIRKLETDLAATERALRLCGYRGDYSEIKPILRRGKSPFGRGELQRLVLDIMREKRCAPFSRDIAAEVIRAKRWAQDAELLASITEKVKGVRRRLERSVRCGSVSTRTKF